MDGYFKHINEADRKYAHRNIADSGEFSQVVNLYDGFTRPQFRAVFTQNNILRKLVFERLGLPWDSSRWTLFFDIFIEENINSSHRKSGLFTAEKRARYMMYSQLSMELISAINRFLSKNIIGSCYPLSNEGGECDGSKFIFSFVFRSGAGSVAGVASEEDVESFLRREDLYTHAVPSEIIDRVSRLVLSKLDRGSYFIENVARIGFLCPHYAVSYPEFICAISYMWKVQGVIDVKMWSGSRVHISRKL